MNNKLTNFSILICFSVVCTSYAYESDGHDSEICGSPKECFLAIQEMTLEEHKIQGYISLNQQDLIDKLLSFKEESTPFILDLLDNNNRTIALQGAIALSRSKSLDVQYLTRTISALDKHFSLFSKVLSEKSNTPNIDQSMPTLATADDRIHLIKIFVKKMLPSIIATVKCERDCDAGTIFKLGYSIDSAGPASEIVAESMINLAQNRSLSNAIRRRSLDVLRYIGEHAISFEGNVLRIVEEEPVFEDLAEQVFYRMKSTHAVKFLRDRFEANITRNAFYDLAKLGSNGEQMGDYIVELLEDENPRLKILAARTLGYIEHTESAQILVPYLHNQLNIPLAYVAAESLGRLNAELALKDLKTVANQHWYPPVRQAAETAIFHIETGIQYDKQVHTTQGVTGFFGFNNMTIGSCTHSNVKKAQEALDYKLHGDEIYNKIAVKDVNWFSPPRVISQSPRIAFKVHDGWLIGTNRGEFGGELIFIADDGPSPKLVIRDNITDIFTFGDKIIVFAGILHRGTNLGTIYCLIQNEAQEWEITPWIILPSAPKTSFITDEGKILIALMLGGSILLSKSGKMEVSDCP